MNLLTQIGKSIFESSAGRIRWRSNMWALTGSRWDHNRLRNGRLVGHAAVNMRGEWEKDGYTLVRRSCTLCPCAPGKGFYFDGEHFWVPRTECRRCVFHMPSGHGFRFPRCTFMRTTDVKKIYEQTVLKMNQLVSEAEKKATICMK